MVIALSGVWIGETVVARRGSTGTVSTGRARGRTRASDRTQTLLPLVVAATIGAAAVHLVVMPTHFEESTLYGVFFAVTASVQLLWAAYLAWRPSAPALLVGAVGNLGLVGLWLFTRLVEIPLGPGAGQSEEFGGLDVLASGFELFMAVAAITLVVQAGGWQARIAACRPTRWSSWAWLASAAAGGAIAVTAVLSPPS